MTEGELIGFCLSGILGLLFTISEYLGSKYHIGQSQSVHRILGL